MAYLGSVVEGAAPADWPPEDVDLIGLPRPFMVVMLSRPGLRPIAPERTQGPYCRGAILLLRPMVGRASSEIIMGGKMPPFSELRLGGVRRHAMRCCMVAMALAPSAAGALSAQISSARGPGPDREPPSIRVTPENVRFANYLRDLAGPRAVVGVVGGGALQQLRQNDGTEFGQRLAQRATQHAAEMSVRHGLAAVMNRGTDYHYQFCECRGFGARVQHALLETFTDRRADGSRALSVPRIAGSYAGEFAGLAWDHDRSVGGAVGGATLSLGFSALFNIGRELTGLGR